MNDGSRFGNTNAAALAAAVRAGDAALARDLVAAGANPDAQDEEGIPLLQWLMLQEDRAAWRLLLELHADPARGSSRGRTALHLAAMANSTYWLDELLARGMSPDTPNTVNGAPPLFNALRARRPENIERLLAAGARLDVHDRNGTTPLHEAAAVNDPAAVLQFLRAGADPRATDDIGKTFQAYLFDGDPALLNTATRKALADINGWLQANGVPVRPRDTPKYRP